MYLYVLKVLKKFVLHCTKNEKLLHFVHLLRKKIFSINRREEHLEKEEKKRMQFPFTITGLLLWKMTGHPKIILNPFLMPACPV